MAPKNEYLCIVPDKPGALQKRLQLRSQHLEGVKPLVENSTIVVGGAMFDEHPAAGQTPLFKGSSLIVVAESKEEVMELIRKDIYSTGGVWDLENCQVIPFQSAVRVGL
ncbi:hypothetical protein HFD88_002285 [Aspergillus terreus]|nr:hypothetical protein HFD88_002285 [Aspergillus terreus]